MRRVRNPAMLRYMRSQNSLRFAIPIAPVVLVLLLFPPPAPAQPAADASGHWTGSIQTPGGDLGVEIDLAKNEKGEWIGAISVPKQNMKGFPLANITIQGKTISFAMKGIPGDPTFQGALSEDAKSISGDFT